MAASTPADLPTLVVDFLNTLDVEARSDVLERPAAWSAWARERELEAGDAERARSARTAIRDLLTGVDAQVPEVSLIVRVMAGGAPELVPTQAGDATSAVLGAVATLAARGALARLRLCRADDCRWAFYDRSKNRSRTWCSMDVCGNRAKTRAHRSRS